MKLFLLTYFITGTIIFYVISSDKCTFIDDIDENTPMDFELCMLMFIMLVFCPCLMMLLSLKWIIQLIYCYLE